MRSVLSIGVAASLTVTAAVARETRATASPPSLTGGAVNRCPAEDASIRVRPGAARPQAIFPPAFGWRVAPSASAAVHVNAWLEADGPGIRKIVSYIPNRLWLAGRCAYTVRESNGFRLAEGVDWFQFDPDRPPNAVTLINRGERGSAIDLVLSRSPGGSQLRICAQGPQESCSPFITSRREIYAIRYLQSVDTLDGELGILERAPNGKLWLIGVGIDTAKLRSPPFIRIVPPKQTSARS